jgi:hypothetical protein
MKTLCPKLYLTCDKNEQNRAQQNYPSVKVDGITLTDSLDWVITKWMTFSLLGGIPQCVPTRRSWKLPAHPIILCSEHLDVCVRACVRVWVCACVCGHVIFCPCIIQFSFAKLWLNWVCSPGGSNQSIWRPKRLHNYFNKWTTGNKHNNRRSTCLAHGWQHHIGEKLA